MEDFMNRATIKVIGVEEKDKKAIKKKKKNGKRVVKLVAEKKN